MALVSTTDCKGPSSPSTVLPAYPKLEGTTCQANL
ncbi:hypothetical protein A2U01_0096677, partial [Trifolium medium]|nr:hypothetical protein [Trifolium medium]